MSLPIALFFTNSFKYDSANIHPNLMYYKLPFINYIDISQDKTHIYLRIDSNAIVTIGNLIEAVKNIHIKPPSGYNKIIS
jgi:hypothetical protein